jgi:hypothetical protein
MMQRINQQLARQSKELAEQSKDLAEQSKELGVQTTMLAIQASADNASMITLAAVTMFFLPATFISVRPRLSYEYLITQNANQYSLFSAWVSLHLTMWGQLLFQMWSGFILPLLFR